MFRVSDGDGAQALDINTYLNRLRGRGVISGGKTTAAAGRYVVEVDAVSVYLDGEVHNLESHELDLEYYVAREDPRKAVLYVDTEGTIVVATGQPEEPQPGDQHRWECYRPAPPDLSNTDCVPLAEVWLSPDDIRVTDADIRDRRVDAGISVQSLDAEVVDFQEIIDGAGVSHDGQLASGEEVQTDEDIREIVNTDLDHGETAPHNYFSGDHADLTNVQSDQHHPRYEDEEAREAVRGSLNIAELLAEDGADGQHAEANGGSVVWSDPPNQQAEEIASGTVTHTGGSPTTALLAGISSDETEQFEIAVGVSEDPSWSGDYAYSISTSRQWDEANGEVNVELTLNWETDPGSGNDLSLAWSAFETSPVVVEGRYTDSDAVSAVDDATISPAVALVQERLNGPTYSDVENITGMEEGDLVVASGDGNSQFGIYIYNGDEWLGPVGTGVESLADLNINTSRDWGGNSILNLGPPDGPADAARVQELNDHAAVSDAHHTKTTSSDIDHANISNVQPDQHHPRYTDEEAVAATAGHSFSSSLTGATIPGGEQLQNFHYVSSDETFTLLRVELVDENLETGSGLEIQLYDRDRENIIYSDNTYTESGTMDSPLARVEGPRSLAVRIHNGTGSELAASGSASFVIE